MELDRLELALTAIAYRAIRQQPATKHQPRLPGL